MPTFGSLFAGIGGIDLGLERAGWECRWQVEWDAYCQRVLAKHWPDVPRYGDITAVDWSGVEPVDLLAGGFPCQPVSGAGKRRAQADERWLWPEFHRAVRALRPRYVLVENVTNLLGVNGGSAFGEVVGDLAASGYDTEWDCVPAAAVGALHERDRVWIVAYADSDGRDPTSSGEGGSEGAAFRPTVAPGQYRGDQRGASVPGAGSPVGDSNSGRREPGSERTPLGRVPVADSPSHPRNGVAVADPDSGGRNGRTPHPERHPVGRTVAVQASADARRSDYWLTEPDVGRVAHGVPARVDRLRALGNAVVPQVVEVIGRQLMEAFKDAA